MKPKTDAETISQLIASSAANPLILCNTHGTIAFANKEAEALLRYNEGELNGRPLECIAAPQYRHDDYPEGHFFKVPQEHPSANRHLHIAKKDGSVVHASVSVIPLSTSDGAMPLLIINEIAEQEKIAEKIDNSDTRFRVFFDNAPEAIVVVDMRTLNLVKNNYNALKLFKLPAEDLKKISLTEISPKIQPDGHSSEDKLREIIDNMLYTERMFFEWMIKDAEGSERLCEMRLVALPDLEEKQLLISLVDIEERKRTENELRADNKRLRFRLENALMGYAEWDTLLHLKTWSPKAQEIFGWTAEEVEEERRSVLGLVHDSDLEWVNSILAKLTEGQVERITVLQRNHTKDGRVIWCEWFYSVLKDKDGKVSAIMALVNDVTERKEAEHEIRKLNMNLEERVCERTAELTEVNKELEGFSYSVSHDLRSPVRAIVSFVSLIKRQYATSMDNDLKEMFEHIESNGRRMDNIIEDLLALAKYGKEKLRPTQIDMTRLFHNVWTNLSRVTNHATVLELPALPQIKGDASLLEQVVVNLLSNAIKYSSKKENPVIQIGYEQDDTDTTFYIKDNGAGFNMEYYDRLFGAFQRLHGMSEFEGTGVGLLLVKRLIEKHGGKVWAESTVGEGATFYFTLPKAIHEATEHKGKAVKKHAHHPGAAAETPIRPKRIRRAG